MKKLLLTIFFIFCITYAFAEVEIYCPKCFEHIYTYKGDEIPKGYFPKNEDFTPDPSMYDEMRCPLCNAYFEGYEYFCWKNGLAIPKKYYPAYTFLTKGKRWAFYCPSRYGDNGHKIYYMKEKPMHSEVMPKFFVYEGSDWEEPVPGSLATCPICDVMLKFTEKYVKEEDYFYWTPYDIGYEE